MIAQTVYAAIRMPSVAAGTNPSTPTFKRSKVTSRIPIETARGTRNSNTPAAKNSAPHRGNRTETCT